MFHLVQLRHLAKKHFSVGPSETHPKQKRVCFFESNSDATAIQRYFIHVGSLLMFGIMFLGGRACLKKNFPIVVFLLVFGGAVTVMVWGALASNFTPQSGEILAGRRSPCGQWPCALSSAWLSGCGAFALEGLANNQLTAWISLDPPPPVRGL